ncbi:hypothetical protein PIB30_047421 [Stylosanthes scabra]|uniref:Uncharacterized protein n=1 Tax=Stylosanthes scabra TaxID=79078 RepID=A0ABU6TIX5_9FABA|nr:hypothetical protein [Stylosanthes scabra]
MGLEAIGIRLVAKNTSENAKVGIIFCLLTAVKKIEDSLATVAAPVSDTEYTNVILDGLNEDYHPFIISVNTRKPPLSVPDLEALLMEEKEFIERLKKPDTSMIQVNLTQIANSTQKYFNSDSSQNSFNNNNNGKRNFGKRGHMEAEGIEEKAETITGVITIDCNARSVAS